MYDLSDNNPLYAAIRRNVRENLVRYAQQGVPTGGFLHAILTNDLKEACKRADENNQRTIFNIVSFCYNELPMGCWGTPEKYNDWLRDARETAMTSPDLVKEED